MPGINPTDLVNAGRDAQTIADIANSDQATTVDRFGRIRSTLESAIARIVGLIGKVDSDRNAAATQVQTILNSLTGNALNDLQGPNGATMIGRPNSRSVGQALNEILSLSSQGGVSSLSQSSQAAFAALLAAAPRRPYIGPGDYLTPDVTYPTGLPLQGPGRLFKAVSGGNQQLNSYADQGDALRHVSGLEYMAAFHNTLITQNAAPTRRVRAAYGGDSTTEGASVSGAYVPSTLHTWLMTRATMQTPCGTDVYNLGHSGWNTEQWRQSSGPGGSGAAYGLQRAMALDLDLLILSLGINDPGWLKNGSAAPASAGQDYPNRRDINDFETSLRGILTSLRGAKTVATQSIILAIPNSTSDTPNGRDERWYEQVAAVYRRAARDFACVLVDKYALFRDSRRAAAGGWMDDIVSPGSGQAVHPLNVMNVWIADVYHRICYPESLRLKVSRGGIQTVAGLEDAGDASRLPNTYHYGVTIGRALNNGYPSTGSVVTIRSADETVLQIFYPFNAAETYYMAFRHGASADLGNGIGWTSTWKLIGGTSSDVTANSPFQIGVSGAGSAERMRVSSNGDHFILEGCVSLASPVAVSAGTQVATLPGGSAPGRCAVYGAIITYYLQNGTFVRNIPAQVSPNGAILAQGASGSPVQRVYINATWSRLA